VFRQQLAQKSGRHRGTRSQSHHYATLVNKFDRESNANPVQQFQDTFEDPIYDELSRTANYQSSKSALDGYGNFARKNQMNKTLQYNH
jgi:hypothetical protein